MAPAPPAINRADESRAWLLGRAFLLEGPDDQELKVAVALAETLAAVDGRARRPLGATTPSSRRCRSPSSVPRARFGTWYELFPRSAGPTADRSGTFDDVVRRLPDIAAMGFDVLYLPPVHPIGRSFRKGPNNALTAGPDDPGQPVGHRRPRGRPHGGRARARHARRFRPARRSGQALRPRDRARLRVPGSPDHPVGARAPRVVPAPARRHDQVRREPAEEIPGHLSRSTSSRADWRALWEALADVSVFWIDHGVRIFRVDNPHTKPFRFWQWLIGEVQARHPDAIFLAEAFTRPKPMCYLAKAGFSQSYTYFTWRNAGSELSDYFTDAGAARRPRVLPAEPLRQHARTSCTEYLQRGGKPAFKVRLVLAATLGASYGIYSGFELCERRAVEGTEEYLDSEKYQRRPRDFDQPGNIKELSRASTRSGARTGRSMYDDTLRFHADRQPAAALLLKVSRRIRPNRISSWSISIRSTRRKGGRDVAAGELGVAPGSDYVVRDLLADERFTLASRPELRPPRPTTSARLTCFASKIPCRRPRAKTCPVRSGTRTPSSTNCT